MASLPPTPTCAGVSDGFGLLTQVEQDGGDPQDGLKRDHHFHEDLEAAHIFCHSPSVVSLDSDRDVSSFGAPSHSGGNTAPSGALEGLGVLSGGVLLSESIPPLGDSGPLSISSDALTFPSTPVVDAVARSSADQGVESLSTVSRSGLG